MKLPSYVVRKRRGLYSQAEIGALLGVSANTIGTLERDAKRTSVPLLLRYCALLGYQVRIFPSKS